MNEDTHKLLAECSKGCKMAIGSMKQVQEYIKDEKQKQIISSYQEKHEQIEQETTDLLREAGKEGKDPGLMAATFSWFTTEIRMLKENDTHQIATLMMNGSNMGVQSIVENQNKYAQASEDAKEVAGRLIRMEEEFWQEMKQFL